MTGGPVRDMAIDPSGETLFLAMEQHGLKRLSLGSGALTSISKETCPIHVAIDHLGERLYVAYQCSGPLGWPGHDSVEIFDARTDNSLAIIGAAPMVGGHTSLSLDDQLAILDGGDACSRPVYDHVECSLVPSHVFHLVRGSNHRILRSFFYPIESQGAYSIGGDFVDNSRFLMLGDSISVVDAAAHRLLERFNLDHRAVSAVVAPDGSRLWAGVADPPELLEFNLEPGLCEIEEPNTAMLFSGLLSRICGVILVPGVVPSCDRGRVP